MKDVSMMTLRRIYCKRTDSFIKVTPCDIDVYSYMYSRYNMFKTVGNSYYDTQEQISVALGYDRKTVLRSIDKLREIGVLEESTKKRNGYVVTYTHVLHEAIVTDEQLESFKVGSIEVKSVDKLTEKKPVTKVKPLSKTKPIVNDLEDEPY